jgi:hypothetical protein
VVLVRPVIPQIQPQEVKFLSFSLSISLFLLLILFDNVIDYPAVPFTKDDFHTPCDIDWGSADSIRRCELVGLPDLDQSRENVRASLAAFMNDLIDLGVAGFRFDKEILNHINFASTHIILIPQS